MTLTLKSHDNIYFTTEGDEYGKPYYFVRPLILIPSFVDGSSIRDRKTSLGIYPYIRWFFLSVLPVNHIGLLVVERRRHFPLYDHTLVACPHLMGM